MNPWGQKDLLPKKALNKTNNGERKAKMQYADFDMHNL